MAEQPHRRPPKLASTQRQDLAPKIQLFPRELGTPSRLSPMCSQEMNWSFFCSQKRTGPIRIRLEGEKTMGNYTHETVPTQSVEPNGIRYAYRRFGNLFRPTTQPTYCDALSDFCVFWQSP